MTLLYGLLPIDILTYIFSYTDPNVTMIINKYTSRSPIIYAMRQQYAKEKLSRLINQDYLKFINCLRNGHFDVNVIEHLLYKNIYKDKIPTLWNKNYTCGYYDLKYIFELMYYMYNNNIMINEDNIMIGNQHFHQCFYQLLKISICNDRLQTIYHINKIPNLRPLHAKFIGYDKILRTSMPILIDYIN